MKELKLACWNVNGLRSVAKKGFFQWLEQSRPDILGLQETKISEDQIPGEMKSPPGYLSFFNHGERRGYSGVALYISEKLKPISVSYGMGIAKFDREARIVQAEFKDFSFLNIYYPNGKSGPERLLYKLEFYDAFLAYAKKLKKQGKKLIICGDFNTAHKEIDLARPKENSVISGFLPEERAWMDKFIKSGFVDTFRHFNSSPDQYSWWSMRTGARERNVGWRIDYIFSSEDLKNNLVNAAIHQDVQGSDHCPISLDLRF